MRTRPKVPGRGQVLAPLRILLVALAVLMLAPSAMAQQSEPKNSESEGEPRYEIFGGYSYKREDSHNLHGWSGTLIVNVNRWFAIASDVDGHYGSHREGAEDVSVHEYAYTFGPHFALRNGSRVTPFAFALFGGAHETVKTAGVPESATSFAANLGGGFDVHINHRVSVRVIQVDAAYTRFHGEGKTSPRFSTGLVISFGKLK
jgi:outer membrane protein with beta-barrel domain